MKDGKAGITIMTEWKIIQDRLSKIDDTMKLHIKENLRKISYPEIIYLKPPSESVKIKGAPKKVKPTQEDNSKKWPPSLFEHVDSHFTDSPIPKSQKSVLKGARISKPHPSMLMPKINDIEDMSFFMQKHIDRIVNVKGDGNCGYRVVSDLLGKE